MSGVRDAGVLLHPTSLGPSAESPLIGDLGSGAHAFVDWLARAGFRAWQMLPIGPVGAGNSPYSSTSSFAIEPMLVALKGLDATPTSRVDWDGARSIKSARLRAMYADADLEQNAAFAAFTAANAHWLPEYCAWLGDDPLYHAFVQFLLDAQWTALKDHAHAQGIALIGDLPIFVGANSADVATRPELFRLNEAGVPTVVTGVPPDDFAVDGQRWGHPHYDWPAHQAEHFTWWRTRVQTALTRFDALRIDHFIGFVRTYEIDATQTHARNGKWQETPGHELLSALQASLGPLPFIAEDLGTLTQEVIDLRREFGLPGMAVLQWSVLEPTPPQIPVDTVVYPGTHDNDTTAGWWASLSEDKRRLATERIGPDPVQGLIEFALSCPAERAIIQVQDLLGLGNEARMNLPGIATGNWEWRVEPNALNAEVASRVRAQLRDSRPNPRA